MSGSTRASGVCVCVFNQEKIGTFVDLRKDMFIWALLPGKSSKKGMFTQAARHQQFQLVTYVQGGAGLFYIRWGEDADKEGSRSTCGQESWKQLCLSFIRLKKEQAFPSIVIYLFNWNCLRLRGQPRGRPRVGFTVFPWLRVESEQQLQPRLLRARGAGALCVHITASQGVDNTLTVSSCQRENKSKDVPLS